ncbi:type II toxin-antitoxin system RelE/ParE family toxin [Arsukibacterium sp.]|uniref:type II toxin-antitoxin system RelE/ParE family toxin n=1 Tax=Arsukibacterium sp. TaxID=1977258 RepID=UPI00299D067D|nr:type II toxin-antitoxin system RelE/ParE family toxin [Arsukibacterium sp.]MDX1537158.1 type II toxin-antitoxin system RelE/ParE family toxin [Arsukibacterium sp.]
MKVLWSANAAEHLDAIFNYIASDSIVYALKTVDAITRRSEQIAQHPLSGRVVPEYNQVQIREVLYRDYRIIYYIKPEQIEVLAVIKSRMLIADS